MKKVFSILFCLVIIIIIVFNNLSGYRSVTAEDLSKRLIRFHVIANSDSISDQALKLKVRDAVLSYMAPKLKNSGSVEETRKILLENDKEVQKIAAGIINKNGYCYNVKTSLSHEYFPIKTYGNITLPQGKYEAYRIIIGDGAGQNWWCVMFPPLCFVDITTEDVDYKKIDSAMKGRLTPSEYNSVVSSSDNIKIKFKTVEVFKKLKAELKKIE